MPIYIEGLQKYCDPKPHKRKENKMNNITFSLNKVSKTVAKKPLYRASVQSNVLIDHDGLATRIAERTKQDAALWKYFIDVLSDEIDNQLLEGNRIKLGRFVTGFAIHGSFASEDEEFDPEKHALVATVRTLDPLNDKLAKIVPENVTAGLTCSVSAVMDAVTKQLSEITGMNRVLIQGMNLGISPDNPDEGVWLADPKTGEIVATAIVEHSDRQTIDCVFTEPPVSGKYTLVVSCRNGARESLKPAVANVKNVIART